MGGKRIRLAGSGGRALCIANSKCKGIESNHHVREGVGSRNESLTPW